MSKDSFKDIRHRNKVATVPIPSEMWDGMEVHQQLAVVQIECAKFAAATHDKKVGGFAIVVVRGDEAETVLSVGKEEAPPAIITPGIIVN